MMYTCIGSKVGKTLFFITHSFHMTLTFEKLSFDILTCHALYEFSYFSALCPRFNIRCLVPCSDI